MKRIKETQIEFGINTIDKAFAEFETSKITGRLSAIVIASEEKLNIRIEADGMCLLELAEFQGKEYFAVRRQGVNERGEGIVQSAIPWQIYTPIKITVQGRKNAQINFRLLFE